ncbi:hypothetical protein, partial [Acinetobacter baumannii]|uniref:hypothetical protein n=1 Tax=Acinetobacter baumannii TaxID=470 RepID=UPI001EEF7C8F
PIFNKIESFFFFPQLTSFLKQSKFLFVPFPPFPTSFTGHIAPNKKTATWAVRIIHQSDHVAF